MRSLRRADKKSNPARGWQHLPYWVLQMHKLQEMPRWSFIHAKQRKTTVLCWVLPTVSQIKASLFLWKLRAYSPKCEACKNPIVPLKGETEALRIIALDKSYCRPCFVCEVIFWLIKNRSSSAVNRANSKSLLRQLWACQWFKRADKAGVNDLIIAEYLIEFI